MKKEKLKRSKSSDYGQYVFRIPERRAKQFERVKKLIDHIEKKFKKTQQEDEKTIRRADIIIEALEIGLKEIKSDT